MDPKLTSVNLGHAKMGARVTICSMTTAVNALQSGQARTAQRMWMSALPYRVRTTPPVSMALGCTLVCVCQGSQVGETILCTTITRKDFNSLVLLQLVQTFIIIF